MYFVAYFGRREHLTMVVTVNMLSPDTEERYG